MKQIIITEGKYTGRTLTIYTLSLDGRYAQATIGGQIWEFKLGLDCRWVR